MELAFFSGTLQSGGRRVRVNGGCDLVEVACANLTLVIMEGEEKVLEAGGKRIKVCRAANWLSGIFGASGESLEFIY